MNVLLSSFRSRFIRFLSFIVTGMKKKHKRHNRKQFITLFSSSCVLFSFSFSWIIMKWNESMNSTKRKWKETNGITCFYYITNETNPWSDFHFIWFLCREMKAWNRARREGTNLTVHSFFNRWNARKRKHRMVQMIGMALWIKGQNTPKIYH